MVKDRYEGVKSYQLITDEKYLRKLKVEAARAGMTVKAFIILAVDTLIEDLHRRDADRNRRRQDDEEM